MSKEFLYWGIVPAWIAVFGIAVSVSLLRKKPEFWHGGLAGAVIGGHLWALWCLKRIFIDNTYPTYVPHVVIGTAWTLTLFQFFYTKKRP
ncbi:MAG: hypothetical protein Q8Q08_06585 [Candidatus Omnitrophota bacterium]|nr:hypothetical protein [Candidatus Omnitrophota bacterium]MDZ4243278.1 hypothetical protein [Candidatus Omnitrophota bacterium]